MVAKSGRDGNTRWKLAPALTALIAQLDKACPDRDRRTDGSIASHQHHLRNPRSDHEPHAYQGGDYVTALDITHNVDKGINCHYLFDYLRISRDQRIKYVIFNKQIFNGENFHTTGAKRRGEWNPGPYEGKGLDPHTGHLHISIHGEDSTDNHPWDLGKYWTIGERQADLNRLGAAQKRIEATDNIGHKPIPQQAAEVRAEADNPQLVEKAVLAMLGDDATSNSLRYMLRFYRQLAGRIGFDGSKPEDAANWVYNHIQGLHQAIDELTQQKADAPHGG